MRDNKDKRLEKKQLLAIREKVASFLLVDVISDKGDFHCRCWTDFFDGMFDSFDYYTICCGKIQYIVCHVQLVVVSDVTFVIYELSSNWWLFLMWPLWYMNWVLLCVFAGSRRLSNPSCALGYSRKQKWSCRGLVPRWRATTKAGHLLLFTR